MRYRLVVIFMLGLTPCFSQTVTSCNKILDFKKLLDANHVSPRAWDEDFAVRMINRLFNVIDPGAMYFTQQEKDLFLSRSKTYCVSLAAGHCSIITDLAPVYENGLTRAEKIIHAIQASGVNFIEKDTFRVKFVNSSYATEGQLKKQWSRLIKLGILLDADGQEPDRNYKVSLEKNCRKYLNIIKRRHNMPEGVEAYVLDKLLNAIATSYDPHTAFFSKNEKQSFLDGLSTDHLSFGIMLQDDALGNIIIGRIIPGSAAWDAGNLHVGDVIVNVKTSGTDNADASLYTAEELEEILYAAHEPIDVSVKKITGEQITTRLVKQKIREDENKVKSLVLSTKETRFGYVNLPVFFSSGELSHSGCATALAKEIIQLKKSKIQGLILDIRNNGGGDLEEAVLLAGIFIDRGAIGIMKYANNETETIKDANPGVAYDGPLLIMVNGGSASASELFAAAMRTHNRAIVIGSKTYGKATGQSVMAFEENEMVKITSFRFYDPLGKSHQGKGLDPDIVLPDQFSLFDFNETAQPYALQADSLVKKTYFTPLPPIPIRILRDSARIRIAKNNFFTALEARKSRKNPYMDRHGITIPLTAADVRRIEAEKDNRSDVTHPVSDRYAIKLTSFEAAVQGVDDFGSETFRILIDEVSKDYYIDEALAILTQYLKIKK